jgi:exodeoxyribonuclease V alpha subunit
MDEITGTIERITFHNPANGYVVMKVQVRTHRDLVAVVGNIPQVVAGEYFEAKGKWVNDREHGMQFQAEELKTTPPHTVEGIRKYLASGLIKGIGPAYAKKIVDLFGDKTLEVIEKSPTFLSEVKGIGRQRLERIRKSWIEQRAVRELMVFLQSYGIGTARAVRIYKTYGDQAVELIRSNPYRLTTDIWGIGFKIADELAQRIGVPLDSPQRARAALRYCLQQSSLQGHVALPELELIDQTTALTGIDHQILVDAIEAGRQEDEFVRDRDGDEADSWIYLKALFLAELGISRMLTRLARSPATSIQPDADTLIPQIETRMGIELAPQQKEAIITACRERIVIITGGPGVGKTTIVKGILQAFQADGRRIALAAPTGRAAKRLSESTGCEAKTIHRLLEFDVTKGGFRKERENPLDLDLLIVDETSMVDVVLFHQLIRAIPPWANLILVGDVDQLPSVGPGMILRDLIESQVLPVVRLTQVFRQAQSSYIVRAAHAIHSGVVPESAPPNTGDFYFIECDEPADIIERMIKVIRDRIPERFGLDPLREVQVLAPMNKSDLGVKNLNQELQKVLNKDASNVSVERFGWSFRINDKVMQTQNNYQKEVFNGDIGRIIQIDSDEDQIVVEFDGRKVMYEFGELDELTLAYAISIHKSQGSEYAAVVIPLHTQHFVMLQRNLIYTGITRGRKLVVLIGSRKALWIATQNEQTNQRYSLLRWRLRKAAEASDSPVAS